MNKKDVQAQGKLQRPWKTKDQIKHDTAERESFHKEATTHVCVLYYYCYFHDGAPLTLGGGG